MGFIFFIWENWIIFLWPFHNIICKFFYFTYVFGQIIQRPFVWCVVANFICFTITCVVKYSLFIINYNLFQKQKILFCWCKKLHMTICSTSFFSILFMWMLYMKSVKLVERISVFDLDILNTMVTYHIYMVLITLNIRWWTQLF